MLETVKCLQQILCACARRSQNTSDSNSWGFCQSESARNNWITALLHTDRFSPSLCIWQVLSITNQFKMAHETKVIYNKTPNHDFKARLNLPSSCWVDGEVGCDEGGESLAQVLKALPPPSVLWSDTWCPFSVLWLWTLVPQLDGWYLCFREYFVSGSFYSWGRQGWSVILIGWPWLCTSPLVLSKKQP